VVVSGLDAVEVELLNQLRGVLSDAQPGSPIRPQTARQAVTRKLLEVNLLGTADSPLGDANLVIGDTSLVALPSCYHPAHRNNRYSRLNQN
jgi:hypothetical protein